MEAAVAEPDGGQRDVINDTMNPATSTPTCTCERPDRRGRVVITIPIIIFVYFVQRRIVDRLSSVAAKG